MCSELSVILTGLLIDDAFRDALVPLKSNRTSLRATLANDGFFLNGGDLTTVQRMLADFEGSTMAEARNVIKSRCPDWPCNKFMISWAEPLA